MNKATILTISAVLVAAALVMGTVATTVAFADSSSTTIKQRIRQSQTISGPGSHSASQSASNTISVG